VGGASGDNGGLLLVWLESWMHHWRSIRKDIHTSGRAMTADEEVATLGS
jgi:hypothetical protein